jgi:hypothetical protein
MGIRETINENPRVALGVMTGIVVIAIGYVVVQVMASRKKFPESSPDSFFSVDDGKTFFAASSDNIPPFDYKGRTAVHAYVFQHDGKRFVGYLERYTPEARAAILAGKRTPQIERYGRELKRPGESSWIKSGDLAAEAKLTQNIRSPDGGGGTPEAVEP